MAITQLNLYSTTQNIANLANNVDYNSIGLDLTDISVNFGTTPWTFTIKQGSIIEKDGNRYIVDTADYTLQAANNSDDFISFTGTAFASSSSRGTYDATKGGFYYSGNRILKYRIDESGSKVYLLSNKNETEDNVWQDGNLYLSGLSSIVAYNMLLGNDLTVTGDLVTIGDIGSTNGNLNLINGDVTLTNGDASCNDLQCTSGTLAANLNKYSTTTTLITALNQVGAGTNTSSSYYIKKPINVVFEINTSGTLSAGSGLKIELASDIGQTIHAPISTVTGISYVIGTTTADMSVSLNPGLYIFKTIVVGTGTINMNIHATGVYGYNTTNSSDVFSTSS